MSSWPCEVYNLESLSQSVFVPSALVSEACCDPTSCVSWVPCKPNFYCGLFQLPELDTDFHCWFFCLPNLDILILFYRFLLLKWGTQWVRLVDRGCLLLLEAPDPTSGISRGPWSPILWSAFCIGLVRLSTISYLCHYHYMELFYRYIKMMTLM
jgi:hypothetical protein